MKKFAFVFSFYVLCFSSELYASMRTIEQISSIAMEKLLTFEGISEAKARCADGNLAKDLKLDVKETYTIASLDGVGFAIVANDDRFPAVIGYSNSVFEPNDLPDGLVWYLSQVDKNMKGKQINYVDMAPRREEEVIHPMITTKWSQDKPYNNLTPLVSGKHAVVGCVALAMAQVCNYLQFPKSASFCGSYSIGPGSMSEIDVNSTYSYPLKDGYGKYIPAGGSSPVSDDYTEEDALKVATLCRDCGYACKMQYYGESGAFYYDLAYGAVNYFGFPKESIKCLFRDYYGNFEWRSILIEELKSGCPVLYSGSSFSGGHAFVIHGMDAEGLFCVNWGWGGSSDGYYDLDLLNPSSSMSFTSGQEMIVGLRTNAYENDKVQSVVVSDAPIKMSYNEGKHSISIEQGTFFNLSIDPFMRLGRISLLAQDVEDGEVTIVDYFRIPQTFESMRGMSLSINYMFDTSSPSFPLKLGHDYKLFLGSKNTNEQEYQVVRCEGGPICYNLTLGNDGQVTLSSFSEPLVPTSLNDVYGHKANTANNNNTYNILGQTVTNCYRGIIISEGRKIIRQ